MSLRFVTGASGSGKSTYVYKDIIGRSQKEPAGRFLIIVPDQFTMQTQLDLVTMHDKKGIMNIDVLSFGRLTHRIFEEQGGMELPMLDDTGKSLIIRRVAAGMQEKLPVLGGNLSRTGYIHEVKSAISEFMQYGVGLQELDELAAFSRKRGQLYHKLKDLRTVYEGFWEFIREKYLTTEESLEVLASLIPSSKLVKDSVIVFDGFTGFTPVQNKVIGQLLLHAREVTVTVTLEPGTEAFSAIAEQELFALSKKTMQSLAELARESGTELAESVALTPETPPRFLKSPELCHLEKNLLRYPVRPYPGKACGSIRLFEASTQREEVRQICIAIRRLVSERDYCYRDIAVICGDYEAYAGCIEQEFAAYGIPVYLDQTRGVTLNPFIEYIKSALQVRVKNYSYESV